MVVWSFKDFAQGYKWRAQRAEQAELERSNGVHRSFLSEDIQDSW